MLFFKGESIEPELEEGWERQYPYDSDESYVDNDSLDYLNSYKEQMLKLAKGRENEILQYVHQEIMSTENSQEIFDIEPSPIVAEENTSSFFSRCWDSFKKAKL